MASPHALIAYWDAPPPSAGAIGRMLIGLLAPIAAGVAFTAEGCLRAGAPDDVRRFLPLIDPDAPWSVAFPGGCVLAHEATGGAAVRLGYHIGLMDDPGGGEQGLRASAAMLATHGRAALAWVSAVPQDHLGAEGRAAERAFVRRPRSARLPARRLTPHAHLVAWRIGAWADLQPHRRAGGACFWLSGEAARGPLRR